MRRYIYNDTLKKYYSGFGKNGMPTWSEKIRHAETFYSLADANEWKYLAYIKQKYGTTDVNTIKNLIK